MKLSDKRQYKPLGMGYKEEDVKEFIKKLKTFTHDATMGDGITSHLLISIEDLDKLAGEHLHKRVKKNETKRNRRNIM